MENEQDPTDIQPGETPDAWAQRRIKEEKALRMSKAAAAPEPSGPVEPAKTTTSQGNVLEWPTQAVDLKTGSRLPTPTKPEPVAEKGAAMKRNFFAQGNANTVGMNPQQVAEYQAQEQKKKLAGTAANVLTTGATGAQVGAGVGGMVGGPPGAAIGGVAGGVGGGILGAMRDPSESPMEDVAGAGAEFAANAMLPGAGSTSRLTRMMRAGGVLAAYGAGSVAGNMGDKAADFTPDTNFGKIAFYTGLSMPALLAHAALPTKQSKLGAMADQFGVSLSPAEETQGAGALSNFFGHGSERERVIGRKQSQQGLAAIEKITGTSLSDAVPTVVDSAATTQTAGKKVWQGFQDEVADKAADATNSKAYNQGITDQYKGRMKGYSKLFMDVPDVPGEGDFAAKYGLSQQELTGFKQAINSDPEQVINQFLPKEQTDLSGFHKLAGVVKVLKAEDPAAAASLGKGLSMRLIDSAVSHTIDEGAVLKGKDFAAKLGAFGTDRLRELFPDPRTADDLMDLAQVMMAADPESKIFNRGVSAGERMMSYVANKQVFALVSGGAGGMGALGASAGNAMAGAAAGAMVAIPVMTIVNYMQHKPGLGKILIAASKGDPTAANRIIRGLMTDATSSGDDTPVQYRPPVKVEGFFRKP